MNEAATHKVSPASLAQRKALPLPLKVLFSAKRIRDWYDYWQGTVYISFSGGKDSTVLLDLVRNQFPNVPAVFVDTGLEYPEVLDFVRTIDNVVWLRPSMPFSEVLKKYGYPVVSKENAQKLHEIRNTKSAKLRNKRLHGDEKGNGKLPEKWKYLVEAPFAISSTCCDVMKKRPCKKYEKETGRKPFIGTMAADSALRNTNYLKNGCNSFEANRPTSTPLGFWRDSDIWGYLKQRNLPYAKIYDLGYKHTGCMFCMFGVHLEKETENRFQRMKHTHPKQYAYCINKLKCGEVLDAIGVDY